MGDAAFLQDHHILLAHARQVIGDAAADDAAADDDDLGMGARGHETGILGLVQSRRIMAAGRAGTQGRTRSFTLAVLAAASPVG